jgi:hypothetical protein
MCFKNMAAYLNPSSGKHLQKEYYVTIDSVDRNRTTWPSTSHFEVKFGAVSSPTTITVANATGQPPSVLTAPGYVGANVWRSFKNVASIELLGCSFPNTNNVLLEPCLYLSFDELKGNYDGTNPTSASAFAKLVPSGVFGGFVQSYGDAGSAGAPQRKISYAPGVRIDKLTPCLKTSQGAIFNFGSDTGETANAAVQTSFTLRVVVNEPYVH